MEQLKEIAGLLQKVERTYAAERSEAIGKLKDKIWNEPNSKLRNFTFYSNWQEI